MDPVTLALAKGQVATVVVAASDAPSKSRRHADFVCDGTDDHVKIQAAIDALPANGGVVELTTGTFTGWVQVRKEHVTIRGHGHGTILTAAGTATDLHATPLRLLADHCTVENLAVDGNKTAMTGSGENYNDGIGIYASHCTVRNCTIEHCESHGIIVWNRDSGIEGVTAGARAGNAIINNRISDTDASAIDFAAGFPENDTPEMDGNIISGNVITGPGGDAAITLHCGSRTSIVGNAIYDTPRHGMHIHTASVEVSVVGNLIHDVGGIGIRTRSTVGRNKRLTITGNTVARTGNFGLFLAALDDSVVANNIVEDTCLSLVGGEHAVWLSYCGHVRFHGNHVIGSPVASLVIVSDCANAAVEGNTLSGAAQHGVAVVGVCASPRVANNVITDVGYSGISLAMAATITGLVAVTGNQIESVGRHGIDLAGVAGATYLDCSRNTISAVGVSGYRGIYGNALGGTVRISENHVVNTGAWTHIIELATFDAGLVVVEASGNTVVGPGTLRIAVPRVRWSGGLLSGNAGMRVALAATDATIAGVTFRANTTNDIRFDSPGPADVLLVDCRFQSGLGTPVRDLPAGAVADRNIGWAPA